MPKAVNKYLPIWNTLKLKNTCRITAPPALHARIIKAVTKCKDRDIGFKTECLDIRHLRCKLYCTVNQSIIVFRLEYTDALQTISLADL